MAKLIKSKERVSEHGEVFTPQNIVSDMCNLIPDSDWSDKSSIFLEPTCGNGNFVVEIIRKKFFNGLSIFDAVNTTFGMDIMSDNIFECRQRVLQICKEYESDEKNLYRLACVIVNNIFVVKDSLEFIKLGKFSEYKFYDVDPTTKENVGGGLTKFMKKNNAPQVKTKTEKEKIEKTAAEFLKKVN